MIHLSLFPYPVVLSSKIPPGTQNQIPELQLTADNPTLDTKQELFRLCPDMILLQSSCTKSRISRAGPSFRPALCA